MEIVSTWTSKEPYETVNITISKLNGSKIVELEYTTELEIISLEYKQTKRAKEKQEIASKYKEVAQEINKQFKTALYNAEL